MRFLKTLEETYTCRIHQDLRKFNLGSTRITPMPSEADSNSRNHEFLCKHPFILDIFHFIYLTARFSKVQLIVPCLLFGFLSQSLLVPSWQTLKSSPCGTPVAESQCQWIWVEEVDQHRSPPTSIKLNDALPRSPQGSRVTRSRETTIWHQPARASHHLMRRTSLSFYRSWKML